MNIMKEERNAKIAFSIFFFSIAVIGLLGIYNYMSPGVNKVYEEVKVLIDKDDFLSVESYIAERYSNGIFFIDDINEKKITEVEEMAVNYMGDVFYKKTGMTISDYISNYSNIEIN